MASAAAPGSQAVASSFNAQAESVAALPDGGVVVSGTISYTTTTGAANPSSSALSIVELNADGSPNQSFGTDGQVKVPISTNQQFQLAVEPSGQILAASTFFESAGNSSYLVARLNPNGALDPTFGTGGVAYYPAAVTTTAADRISEIASVLPQSNGQIVLAGSSGAGFSAVRLNSNGSLDTGYGQDGTATVPATFNGSSPAYASGGVMQANGQVVLVGDMNTYQAYFGGVGVTMLVNADVGVTRLNTDGSLDNTFGGSTAAGLIVIPPSMANPMFPGFNSAAAVAVDPGTGKILVRGFDSLDGAPSGSSTIYRLNTDGTFDSSFGTGGLVNPTLPGVATILDSSSFAIQANGDIVLANTVGFTEPQRSYADKIELIRLNPDGSTDTTFGGGPTPGLVLTSLTAGSPPAPVIRPGTGDVLVAGVGTVPSITGLTYGLTVDSVLAATTAGPAAKPAPPTPPADFSGLGHSDVAAYQPSSVSPVDPDVGSFVSKSVLSPGIPGIYDAFGSGGVGGSIPAAADYLGVGFDQVAVYLPSIGAYAIQATAGSPMVALSFGVAGVGQTIPRPGGLLRDRSGRRRGLPAGLRRLRDQGPLRQDPRLHGPARDRRGGPVDPGAGGLFRHRPGRRRGLPDPARRVRRHRPGRQSGGAGPLRQAGRGAVGAGAGRLRRLGPDRVRGLHPQLRRVHLSLGDHRQGRRHPDRRGEFGRDRRAGRLRRLGPDGSGGLQPGRRVPRVPAGQGRAGGDDRHRHGEGRLAAGGGARGFAAGFRGLPLAVGLGLRDPARRGRVADGDGGFGRGRPDEGGGVGGAGRADAGLDPRGPRFDQPGRPGFVERRLSLPPDPGGFRRVSSKIAARSGRKEET